VRAPSFYTICPHLPWVTVHAKYLELPWPLLYDVLLSAHSMTQYCHKSLRTLKTRKTALLISIKMGWLDFSYKLGHFTGPQINFTCIFLHILIKLKMCIVLGW
jgi:hypothetical protein